MLWSKILIKRWELKLMYRVKFYEPIVLTLNNEWILWLWCANRLYHECNAKKDFPEFNGTTTTPTPYTHYNDVMVDAVASQITSLTIVYSTVYSGVNQSKYQSSASLAFVREIHRWPVNSPHKGPVTWKMFPFNDASYLPSKIKMIPIYSLQAFTAMMLSARFRPS